MKRLSAVLVGALVVALAVFAVGSGSALAGGKAGDSFAKALGKSIKAMSDFVKKHPDSAEADQARAMLVYTFRTLAPSDVVKKHMKVAKALLADLEERGDRSAQRLKGRLDEIEMIGKAPKAIETTDLDGEALSLDDYKGKVLLIDFWATWCGPCIQEMPNVQNVYAKYKDKGFDILGISLDQDETALTDYIKENEIPWRQVFDGKGWQSEIAVLYGVKSIPKTYLLDPDGKVFEIGVRGEALEKAVAELVSKRRA